MAGSDRDRSDPRTSSARRLRRDATPAERRLWSALRLLDLPSGHFRRQTPVGPYFADFAHHGLRLVIELDGDQHGRPEGLQQDVERTALLEHHGYKVLRFWNHEVRDNLDGVVETILAAVVGASSGGAVHAEPPPTPTLPTAPRGEGAESVAPR